MTTYQISNIQFKNYDKYKNAAFILNVKDNPNEHKELYELNDKIEDKYPDAASCLYVNEEFNYIILRLTKQTKIKFKPKNTYNITYSLKIKTLDDGRKFINAALIKSKCTARYVEIVGEDLEL